MAESAPKWGPCGRWGEDNLELLSLLWKGKLLRKEDGALQDFFILCAEDDKIDDPETCTREQVHSILIRGLNAIGIGTLDEVVPPVGRKKKTSKKNKWLFDNFWSDPA